MAITKVGTINTIPTVTDDWTNTVKHINAFINQVNNQAFILSDPLGTTSPTIKQGCYINHGGTLYIVDTEDYTPSGSPADGNVYIKLTPSGDTLVGSFITDISSYSFNQQYGNMVSGDDMILPYLLVKSGENWTKYRYQPMSASFGAVKATTVDTGQGANELYPMDQDVMTSSRVRFAGLNTWFINQNKPKTWSQVGSGLSITVSGHPSICSLSSTTIVFIDSAYNNLTTFSWNGSTWSQVGSALPISGTSYPSICSLSSTTIALIGDGNDILKTYTWNGSTWSQVGSGLTISSNDYQSICSLSSNTIAHVSQYTPLRTYSWNGSSWSAVGTGLSIPTGMSSMCSLSFNTIAFIDGSNKQLRTYTWNGSTWTLVGTGLDIATVGVPSICSLSSDTIAFIESTNDMLKTYTWNGSTWTLIGTGLGVSNAGNSSICSLLSDTIAFLDDSNAQLRTYKLSFSDFPPNPAFGTL